MKNKNHFSLAKKFHAFLSMLLAMALMMSLFTIMGIPAMAASTSGNWTDYATAPSLEGTTFTIKTASELAWVAKESYEDNPFDDYTIKLANSIDLSGHYWVPISNTEDTPFMGILDGGGYTISNMTIDWPADAKAEYEYVGFFGDVFEATLKDVCLSNVSIHGTNVDCCGSLIGNAQSSKVTNCMSTGSLVIDYDSSYKYSFQSGYHGGLIGYFRSDTENSEDAISSSGNILSNSFSSCSVTSGDDSVIGGLVGVMQGTMVNCGATGKVVGGQSIKAGGGECAGGLAAVISGQALNCFSTGDVTIGSMVNTKDAAAYIGGLVSNVDGLIKNCYASGTVNSVSGASSGGLVGDMSNNASIDHCYWVSKEAYGKAESNVLLSNSSSKTADDMKSSAFSTLLNDNAKNISSSITLATWIYDAGANGGYPALKGVGSIGNASNVSTAIAKPTSSAVLVNGGKISLTAYNINGSNYFKLRDLAFALNKSEKQFSVGWDGAVNAIKITSGEAYTPAGGELTVDTNTANATATPTTSAVYLNGVSISLTAYNINGNNYIKLRDLASVIDFGVSFDSAANTISINTSAKYLN